MTRMTKPGHAEMLKATFNRVYTMVIGKNEDYTAGSTDPYANFRLAEQEDVLPMSGVMLRTNDKMQRIRSFIAKVKAGEPLVMAVPGEGVEDAFDDVIGYMEILRGMAREEMGTVIEVEPETTETAE